MNLSEAVAISASSLWAHKLRSILTLIGVVIGVAAVIAVVSLINGANQYVATRVFRLGADVFGLSKQPSIITNVDDWLAFQKRKRITYDDYEAVRELCKSCKEIGASLGGRVEVKSGLNSLKDTNLRAWTPQMAQLYDVDLLSGRHMTEEDLRGAAPVCVIGNDLIENLMPGIDAIGKEVRWNNIPCEVIGAGKKQGSALGTSLDNWIIIPLTTYKKNYGNQQDSLRVTSRAGSAAKIQESVDEVRQIMRGRHHIAYAKADDFAIETSDSFLALWKDISGSFFAVTIAIASISLVVVGILIMNIMLVSVTERTREIGVRKALGAPQRYPASVFDRIFHGRRNWRRSRCILRRAGGQARVLGVAFAQCCAALVRDRRAAGGAECRPFLRNLSGIEGREARSRRSAAVGVRKYANGHV
ncbi:MAG TPA: ABC transporter permease [Candidatus Acidoferrum sp.]